MTRFLMMTVLLVVVAMRAWAVEQPAETDSGKSVPAVGITIIRIVNLAGHVEIIGVAGSKEIACSWSHTAPTIDPRATVHIEKRENMLEVVGHPPEKMGGVMERLDIKITAPQCINVDIEAAGDVEVSDIEGVVRVTGGHDVDVKNLRGGFDVVTSGYGRIHIAVFRLDQGGNSARSERGDIQFEFLAGLPVSIEAYSDHGTVTGNITSGGSVRRGLSGHFNGGGLSVWLHSQGGIIEGSSRRSLTS